MRSFFRNKKVWIAVFTASVFFFQNCGQVNMVDTLMSDRMSSLNSVSTPSINYIIVANTDTMNGVSAERVIAQGQTVYIRWTLRVPPGMTGTPRVSLSYFSNENAQTTIITNLNDGSNNGCLVNGPGSADDSATGCFVWQSGSPTSSYYQIRVTVSGLGNADASGDSLPINANGIQFLAGSTTNGLNADARNAVLTNDIATSTFQPDGQSLVVSSNGTVFFRDIHMGIVYFNPTSDLTLRQLLRLGATASGEGDGGVVTNAKLKSPTSIAIDSQDRLLILDYDRIRRVDFSTNPATITTIIGGGSETGDIITNPRSLRISPTTNGIQFNPGDQRFPLRVLPNNDIVFFSDSYGIYSRKKIRLYREASGQNPAFITSLTTSGAASFPGNLTTNVDQCSISDFDYSFSTTSNQIEELFVTFSTPNACGQGPNRWYFQTYAVNPATGAYIGNTHDMGANSNILSYPVAAKDGKMYRVQKSNNSVIYQWNTNSRTWIPVVGTGTLGSCIDGTSALSCNISADAAFVDANSKIYFADRGKIRTIRNGRVITLGGQGTSFGDGGAAINARFGLITAVQSRNDNGLVVLDMVENRFRQFYRGGLISTIAGNGGSFAPDSTNPATSQPFMATAGWDQFKTFAIDQTNNDIIYSIGNRGARLKDSTNLWEVFLGGGSTQLKDASNGALGQNLLLHGVTTLAGYNGTNALFYFYAYNGVNVVNSSFFTFNTQNNSISFISGPNTTGYPQSYCTDGSPLVTCPTNLFMREPFNRMSSYDSVNNQWLLLDYDSQTLRTFTAGSTIETKTRLAHPSKAFIYKRFGNGEFIFYCRADTGVLARRNLRTNTETALAAAIPGLSCAGSQYVYDATNHSLVFIFEKNGLNGVAELFSVDPPLSEQQ